MNYNANRRIRVLIKSFIKVKKSSSPSSILASLLLVLNLSPVCSDQEGTEQVSLFSAQDKTEGREVFSHTVYNRHSVTTRL